MKLQKLFNKSFDSFSLLSEMFNLRSEIFVLLLLSMAVITFKFHFLKVTLNDYFFQTAILIVDRVSMDNIDDKVGNIEVNQFKTPYNEAAFNISFTLRKDLHKILATIGIYVPSGPKDKNYDVEFFKVTVDVERLFKHLKGNFATKEIVKKVIKSMDFPIDFPWKAVS